MDKVELERKFVELLGARDVGNLDKLIPEILKGISPIPRYPLIGRDMVEVDDISGQPGRAATYTKEKLTTGVPRKLSIFDPEEVPEGGEFPETYEDVDYITAIPVKYGKKPMVTKEMIEDAMWDVIARNTMTCMQAAKEFEDKKILDVLHTNANSTVTTTSSDVLALDEVREAFRTLVDYGWYPTDLIVNPDLWESMLAYSQAATTDSVSEAWREGTIRTGRMPPVFGIPVTVTPLMTDSASDKSRGLMLVRKSAGILTLKRDWTIEAVSEPSNDTQGVIVSARFAVSVLHPTAVVAITSA